jgi:putative PIN family toxin of toxin-antitoxin system
MRKFRATNDLADETDEFLRRESEVIGKAPRLQFFIRDKDDLTVLEQAVADAADVLVTGDRDLLELESEVPVPTPRRR